MKVTVVGLGTVGLPVAASLAQTGHSVVGIDIDAGKVDAINRGELPLPAGEPELEALVAGVVSEGRLLATRDYDRIADADAVLICVDTPVDPLSHQPDYTALRSSLEDMAAHMKKGVLVSVESTLAPGTMAALVLPTLEAASGLKGHRDFHLVHCPERLAPGNLLHNLVGVDRIVGGEDVVGRRRAIELYRGISAGTLHETSWIDAELCKTAENAYRDVQLAFANEVALVCEAAGGDVLEVRRLVNTCPGRSMLFPGPGVGGACLPKDSWLLVSSHDGASLIPAARNVNDGMPDHVAELVEKALGSFGLTLQGATVTLLGVGYRENVALVVNSPALPLSDALRKAGAEVRLHDPFVTELDGTDVWGDLGSALDGADCAVLVTAHDAYQEVDWSGIHPRMSHTSIVDCRGVFPRDTWEANGFKYFGLGRTGA